METNPPANSRVKCPSENWGKPLLMNLGSPFPMTVSTGQKGTSSMARVVLRDGACPAPNPSSIRPQLCWEGCGGGVVLRGAPGSCLFEGGCTHPKSAGRPSQPLSREVTQTVPSHGPTPPGLLGRVCGRPPHQERRFGSLGVTSLTFICIQAWLPSACLGRR